MQQLVSHSQMVIPPNLSMRSSESSLRYLVKIGPATSGLMKLPTTLRLQNDNALRPFIASSSQGRRRGFGQSESGTTGQ
jgi:hypothetical protein